jgi:hypothetical protein
MLSSVGNFGQNLDQGRIGCLRFSSWRRGCGLKSGYDVFVRRVVGQRVLDELQNMPPLNLGPSFLPSYFQSLSKKKKEQSSHLTTRSSKQLYVLATYPLSASLLSFTRPVVIIPRHHIILSPITQRFFGPSSEQQADIAIVSRSLFTLDHFCKPDK